MIFGTLQAKCKFEYDRIRHLQRRSIRNMHQVSAPSETSVVIGTAAMIFAR